MDKSTLLHISSKLVAEVERANKIHGQFTSLHHAYAVILEELDELWKEIKCKQPDRHRLTEEATHVGAMAVKLLAYLEDEGRGVGIG